MSNIDKAAEHLGAGALNDTKMLINAANQAMVALQETHYAMISAGLLDQERLNKNFTAHEELRAALARFGKTVI